MMPYLKKEWLEHIRKHRCFILSIAALLFAISAPVVLYFLPHLLENQVQGIDINSIFDRSQFAAIQNFAGDVYEIFGLLSIVFASFLIHKEFKNKTIVIPYTNGLSLKKMIWSKFIVYSIMIEVILFVSFIINYIYSGVVFNDLTTSYIIVFSAFLSLSSYVIYHVAIAMLLSTYTKSTFISIACSAFSYYGIPALVSMIPHQISPYKLLDTLTWQPINTFFIPNLIITWISSILLISIATRKKMEI